jgi:hypothetical protein
MSYSPKQHLFLVVFELSGPNGVVHEVVLYWEQTDLQTVNSKGSSIRGISFLTFILLTYALVISIWLADNCIIWLFFRS